MKRRALLLGSLAASLTGLAGLTGCTTKESGSASATSSPAPGSSPSGAPLTVGLTYIPDIQFAPFYVAEKRGLFSDAGLTLHLRHHGQQEGLLNALTTGDEDVVFCGGDEMMVSRTEGIDVVNFATMYQSYPVVLIVPEDSPIHSFADLKGRSGGLPGPYGENWYGLLAMMSQAGLTESDLDIQYIGYTQQAALVGKRVDSVIGFINNDVVRFERSGLKVRALELDPEASTPSLVGVGLGAKPQLVAERQADLAVMLTCLREAMTWINTNLDETVAIASEYVSSLTTDDQRAQARAILEETMKLYGDPAVAGRIDQPTWNAMAQFMEDHKIIKYKVHPQDCYSMAVLDKILG